MKKLLLAGAFLLGASLPAAASSGCGGGGWGCNSLPSITWPGHSCGSYHPPYHGGSWHPGYVYTPCGKRYVGKYYWPWWKRPDVVIYEGGHCGFGHVGGCGLYRGY